MIETINANCLDVLKETAANSQDLIFCDPPYALGSDVIIRKDGKPDYRKAVDFMSKWQQPDGYFWEAWFAEAFRVLRYGGRVVMFGMDRQLMLNKYYACFAGFAEQQSLYWYFISNFPKASDLGKMLDKNAGAEREVVGEGEHWGRANRTSKNKSDKNMVFKYDGKAEQIASVQPLTAPATTLAQKYDGMKYSIAPLKQTNETILVFQKPYKTGSCLHDTLAYENGDNTCMCGAVDVEGNRCEIDEDEPNKRTNAKNHKRTIDNGVTGYGQMKIKNGGHACLHDLGFHNSNGRYPAQTYCDDEAAKVLDRQSGISKSSGGDGSKYKSDTNIVFKKETIVNNGKNGLGLGDTGGCSRILHRCNYDLNDYDIYMYCPKVSNRERNEGCEALNKKRRATLAGADNDGVLDDVSERSSPAKNHHPTVKPIALLKKIIQLFKTPNPLHVLDPFMGSGSMGIACIELGVSYTGVELDTEYYTIAQTRLAHHNTKNKSKLF
jgi:DNA modification methylase